MRQFELTFDNQRTHNRLTITSTRVTLKLKVMAGVEMTKFKEIALKIASQVPTETPTLRSSFAKSGSISLVSNNHKLCMTFDTEGNLEKSNG